MIAGFFVGVKLPKYASIRNIKVRNSVRHQGNKNYAPNLS